MNILQANKLTEKDRPAEAGQSMVLLALVLIGLLAFAGIAVDVGFAFVRSAQFAAAVDSATLAGVVDLNPLSEDDTTEADIRAGQFLGANGWPLDTLETFASSRSYTIQGLPQYTITATWMVDTFFLSVLGFDDFPVTHSATAAFFAQSELYTPTAYDRGQARKASLFVFGPDSCTQEGDPVSPLYSTAIGDPNESYAIAEGIYRFRFSVPRDYPHEQVRIEIFDPDTVNLVSGIEHTVTHSDIYYSTSGISEDTVYCTGGDGQSCVEATGENLTSVFHNPFWFVRVDETWNNCTSDPDLSNGDTETRFEVYYHDSQGSRIQLARYTDRNEFAALTDMRWVAPGTGGVPAEVGSFEVPVTDIPIGIGNARYIYMEVKTVAGGSKNVFDVKATLPHDVLLELYPDIAPDWIDNNHINERNLFLANNPAFDPSGSVRTFALGRMPLRHYYDGSSFLDLPLTPIGTGLTNGVIYATLFDLETSDPREIEFTIDSVATMDFRMIARVTDNQAWIDAQVYHLGGLCNGGLDCDNEWIWPQYRMGVPELYTAGTLFGRYQPDQDSHTWSISVTSGRPILTR
jgi:Flp pilus assembly protein TadG